MRDRLNFARSRCRLTRAQYVVERCFVDPELLQNRRREISIFWTVARDSGAEYGLPDLFRIGVVLRSAPKNPAINFDESAVFVCVDCQSPPEEQFRE